MDIEKIVEVNNMLDCYGKLLTEKQLETMNYYYRDNLSLSEIAEKLKITRQAVSSSIKQSIQEMLYLEKIFHFVKMKEILLNEEDCPLKEKLLALMED